MAAAAASEGEAQVLSGTLRRSPDASAAAGVLVLAEQVGERRIVARTITSATGEYRLLLGEARVVVRALRVGFAPVTLDTVQLAPGEHRILDAVLEAIPADLRAARIVADSRCSAPADAVDVVGQLLQQARTALLATNQAVSGETFVTHAEVDRHSGTALLTQRVLETSGVGAFRGHGVDTILRAGFLTERRDGSLEYRAPDTDVLLNDAFLADYCVTLAQDTSGRPGELGVHFRPARRRGGRVEIEGTLWLDARRASLREFEFAYVGADPIVEAAGAGGRLVFTELDNGLWFVHAWELRMPGVREVTVVARAGGRPMRVRAVTEVARAQGRVLSITAGGMPVYTVGRQEWTTTDWPPEAPAAPLGEGPEACGAAGAGVIGGRVTSHGPNERAALPFVEIEAAWPHRGAEAAHASVRRVTADALGFFRFCDVPRDVPVRLLARTAAHEDGKLLVRVEPDALAARVELSLRRR